MQIFTSYFAKFVSEKPCMLTAVSIARSEPPGFIGYKYMSLAPTSQILSDWQKYHDEAAYKKAYQRDVLDHLDPKKVLAELEIRSQGRDVLLLCWENPQRFCHRHLAADWLTKNGIPVSEYKAETAQYENLSLFDM